MIKIDKPVWLMQPIPYFGEELKGEWIFEPKFDGWRLETLKTYIGEIRFFGRRLEKNPDWTKDLEYLCRVIEKKIPNNTILDGELYSDKRRRFIPSLFSKNAKANPIVFIFDIIYFDGEFLGNLPLYKRKEILSKINFEEPFYCVEYHFLKDINSALNMSLKEGNEGIVIKKWNSFYKISDDGPVATENWRKIKRGD